MQKTSRRVAAGAAVVVLMGLTGACSGGVSLSGTDGDSGAAPAVDSAVAPETAGRGSVGKGSETVADEIGANRAVVQVRSVIFTGEVAVTGDDLDRTRERLDDLLAELGGQVDREETEHDPEGRTERSTVVIRVPVDRFEAAMTGVQELGRVQHADTARKDVTTQVIDVDERVQTLQASLDRLQDFQRDARDVNDLIRFEQQITEREAELQSLTSQQAYLTDQTSMSTITLHLSTPERYVAPARALEDAGFVTGLRAGWSALVSAVVVGLTVVGAVLPFTAALALLGVPLWLLVRRGVRRGRVAPEPAVPPAD